MLSVVIPAFEESELLPATLATVVAVVQELTDHFEILVVDDGSTDGTFAQVVALHQQDARFKGVRFSRNFGKEAALLAGMRYARGLAVVTMDADLQHPPQIISTMYQEWHNGAQIVHGVKVSERPRNWLHLRLSHLFNHLFTRLSGFDLELASDFKLLDRKVVHILAEQLPESTRFMRGLSCWVGFRQASVPFAVPRRRAGHGRWGYTNLTAYALQAITSFSFWPLLAMPLLGGISLLLAMVLGVMVWLGGGNNQSGSDMQLLTMVMLFSSGAIMVGLGIIGQYLANVHRELQRRPPFLVADIVGIELKSPTTVVPAEWQSTAQ